MTDGEREREQHDVERVERPAERRGDQRASRRGVGDAPPSEEPSVGGSGGGPEAQWLGSGRVGVKSHWA